MSQRPTPSDSMKGRDFERQVQLEWTFPISAAKVKAMLLRLEATGHTTFVI